MNPNVGPQQGRQQRFESSSDRHNTAAVTPLGLGWNWFVASTSDGKIIGRIMHLHRVIIYRYGKTDLSSGQHILEDYQSKVEDKPPPSNLAVENWETIMGGQLVG